MIEFKLSSAEINELQSIIPNFDVILKALQNNPKINLIIVNDGKGTDL